MAGTPPEDLLEWLMREEELVGVGAMQRGTFDVESARRLLEKELEIEVTESRITAVLEWGQTRYEALPAVGVLPSRFERPWGFQMVYRDVTTGKFISYATVKSKLALL